MKYSDYTTLLSSARMSKYIRACNGDKAKAIGSIPQIKTNVVKLLDD